jgi:hypothetical protein
MPWISGANTPLGYPVPGFVETSEIVPVGTVCKFFDPVQGEGEFIFLPGVASTVLGNAVEYTLTPGAEATIRHTNATGSNSGRAIAFATAATVAGTWGWYQIAGCAIATVAAGFVNNGVLFGTATAGVLDDAADAGDQILNALGASAVGTPAANQAYVTCRYPFVQGQIT